jgi:2-polyprenyl-3-methyl-5-hydroxy-6-metoxy-1,4-benzoquinol methylase
LYKIELTCERTRYNRSMNVINRLMYNLMYFAKPPWDTGHSPPELMEFIETHQPGRALDLGCGTGTNVITLAKHGWQVLGVDFISKPIKIARKKAEEAGVQVDLIVDDVTSLKGIEGPFDLVLDMGCFHSLISKEKNIYVQNVRTLLAANGTFLLYAFTQFEGKKNRGITQDEQHMIETYLKLMRFKPGTDRDEGKMHSAWFWFENGKEE